MAELVSCVPQRRIAMRKSKGLLDTVWQILMLAMDPRSGQHEVYLILGGSRDARIPTCFAYQKIGFS